MRSTPSPGPSAAREAPRPLQRIGLSATQRPLEEVGRFLVGAGRECTVVDTGIRKPLDLEIRIPVEDMREPGEHDVVDPAVGGMGTAAGGGDLVGPGVETLSGLGGSGAAGDGPPEGEAATRRSIWPAIYPELLELVRAHRSTILFVNSRRGAERLAARLNELAAQQDADAAGDGDGSAPPDATPPPRSPAPTTGRSRARSGWWWRRSSSRGGCRASSPPRRWSSGSTWGRSTSCSRSSRRSRSPRGSSGSGGRATAWARSR